MSNITQRIFPQFPSNLILNFVSLQLNYTSSINVTHRTFPQLPSPTSSRIAPTSSRGLSACAVDSFSSGDISSQYAWKITAIFFIVVTIAQLVPDCHYHRHNHFQIIHKIIILILSCYMGNSRCATIAAAYLMIKKDYSATQALQYMRNSRLWWLSWSWRNSWWSLFLPPNHMQRIQLLALHDDNNSNNDYNNKIVIKITGKPSPMKKL